MNRYHYSFLKIPIQFAVKVECYLFTSAEPVFVNILRSPAIDSEESIPPAYVAWRAGRVIAPARHAGNRFLDSLQGLQKRALVEDLTLTRRGALEKDMYGEGQEGH